MAFYLDLMNHPICFASPRRLTPVSAWHEHIPFAMFLVDLLKPNTIVELGTYYGDSYCAFCQAVHELRLATRCYAIDTWIGDPHSGFYGFDVLPDLQAHHDRFYGSFSKLIQSTFDNALQHFDDQTIDLLHIDGYHSYETVKHDFTSWLPKMSQSGVILLHDIKVREHKFGVLKLSDKLKSQYPHFYFLHGYGLGVLAIGKDYPKAFQELLEAEEEDVIKIRDSFFELGRRLTLNIKLTQLQQVLVEKEQHVAQLQQVLVEKEQQVVQLTAERARLDQIVQNQQHVLSTIYASLGWKIVRRIWKLTDILLPKGTKRRVIAKLIYMSPPFLTRRNLGSIVKYIRLFGLTQTYKEVNKKLWSDTYVSNGAINIIPVINNILILREEALPNVDATISVVIPVKNAGDDFQRLLSLMKNQKGFKDIEIIIVDSGSTDRSLEISEEFRAKIVKILPEEFSHSYARNLGAEQASGDYLLFTVQDALPPSNLWLYELFSEFKSNGVVAVSCAEFPREDADLFYRVLLSYHYKFLGVDKEDRIMCKPDHENHLTLRTNGQLSNIACLISKDVFMNYRFRGNYAEDLDLGLRLIRDGYQLLFLRSIKIIHSHNRPVYHHLKRAYVDNLSLSQILPDRPIFAVEAERLFPDIIFVYEVVNSIVVKELQQVDVPCTIKKLSTIIMEKLHTAANSTYPVIIDFESNGYLDSKFRAFMKNVYNRYYVKDKKNSLYNGILLGEMQTFTKMILEYMNDNYDLIDDIALNDFKSCLYKAYAWLCGLQLASTILRGSESSKYKIKEINDELIKEV